MPVLRSKNNVYLLAPYFKGSVFVQELKTDANVELLNLEHNRLETLKNIENESDRTLFSLNLKSDLGYNKVRLPFEKPIEQEIEERISSRSKAGDLLPRGFQKIDFLEVIVPKSEEDEVQTPPIEETEFTLE